MVDILLNPGKSSVFIVLLLLFIFGVPEKTRALDLGLIEPAALNQSLSSWVVLDARPKKEWLAGHIPGARSFCWEDYTRTDEKGIPYRTLPPRLLAEAFGKAGIDENKAVVVYGDADTSWGGEGWNCWAFVWMGHKGPVRLLDGGIQAWKRQALPVNFGEKDVKVEAFVYHYQIESSINISARDIRGKQSAFQLVDTRSTLEWFKGRIPGAVHISWEKFFSGKNRRPIDHSKIRALLEQNGIKPGKPVVYYCTGGIRSGYAWLVHSLAGLPPAVNFEGGMEEWGKTAGH